MPTHISYGPSEEAWSGFEDYVIQLIEKNRARKICDIGGGANPLLSVDIIKRKGLQYYLLDLSATELDKAPKSYLKIIADIAAPHFSINESNFDLVLSKMVAEHVRDGLQFHKNVRTILRENGLAVHFFPTLYALPFLVNRLTPEVLVDKLTDMLTPRDRHQHAKFPAYYHWCRGPLRSQIRKFEDLGYEVIEYGGFFGHAGYYQKLPPVRWLHGLTTRWLLRTPKPLLTSYARVVLKRD
jgi:2-polyprenyl-3-methyl-5-hydroxy-6-metoxy-1,4-benzoquinol methylase